MGGVDHQRVAGVVLVRGRTRMWVTEGDVHWQDGRRSTVVPGGWVRQVAADGQRLTVRLLDGEELTARHRSPEVVSALAGEIESLIGDSAGDRVPIRRETPSVWPVRVIVGIGTGLADWVRDLTVMQRGWLLYAVLGVPLVLAVPGSHWLVGLFALPLFAAGFGLIWACVRLTRPRTRWVVARRGVTVQATVTALTDGGVRAEGRTLRDEPVVVRSRYAGRRDEIRYDPQDPSRALLPTRIMWLVDLVFGLFFGALGVLLCTPLLYWALALVLGI